MNFKWIKLSRNTPLRPLRKIIKLKWMWMHLEKKILKRILREINNREFHFVDCFVSFSASGDAHFSHLFICLFVFLFQFSTLPSIDDVVIWNIKTVRFERALESFIFVGCCFRWNNSKILFLFFRNHSPKQNVIYYNLILLLLLLLLRFFPRQFSLLVFSLYSLSNKKRMIIVKSRPFRGDKCEEIKSLFRLF